MKLTRLVIMVAICAALSAGVALASWYDDYDNGLNAIKAGQWKTAVDKMTAAIAGNHNENSNARTYGAIFINYHPYYYRAVAYINLGQYQKAIDDLEKTSGPGPVDRGTIDTLMAQAKKGAEVPPPVTETVRPPVTNTVAPPPVLPTIDNALRNRARAALDQAKTHLQGAQQRNATNTPAYQSAQDQYIKANSRWSSAKTNDDLTQILTDADNISLLADSANVTIATNTTATQPPVTTTIRDKPGVVTQSVLGPVSRRLRQALENYFNGDFDEATQGFGSLSRELPHNGWIWAFLGASQYSQYAFEGGDSYKDAAMSSFRKARTYGKWKNGLPDKYFSRRIRNAFKQIAG
jgi:tetratricopeptide (TPR) repeat protein